jgi:RNA polymerase sigma factor (sigma-70 family)
MPTRKDDELWQDFQRGSHAALEVIFLSHYDDLYHYGLKLTGDEELVKDCLQDLFFKLWKNRLSLSSVKVIRPYLYKSLRHVISNAITASSRKKKLTQLAASDTYNVTFSQEDFLIQQQHALEKNQKLLATLNGLSNRQREAIYLRFFGELDYGKIAEVMNINPQSVRNLVHQAFKLLKEQLTHSEFLYLLLLTLGDGKL